MSQSAHYRHGAVHAHVGVAKGGRSCRVRWMCEVANIGSVCASTRCQRK